MGESSRELLDFSDFYRQKAHNAQRTGPLPGSTPHLGQIDDMMKHGSRIQESLNRLREVVVNQQADLAVKSREKAARMASVEIQQQEDANGAGGFAGGDSKKRRGVSLDELCPVSCRSLTWICSARLHPVNVTVVTGWIRRSGDEVPMVLGPCAMLVDFVSALTTKREEDC